MLEGALSVLGIVTIFTGLLIVPSDRVQLQIVVVLAGIIALEAGIWGLTQQLLPNARKFLDLRAEGDHFIDLVRALNEAAIASKRGATADADTRVEDADGGFEEVVTLMHESVDRMRELAGKVG